MLLSAFSIPPLHFAPRLPARSRLCHSSHTRFLFSAWQVQNVQDAAAAAASLLFLGLGGVSGRWAPPCTQRTRVGGYLLIARIRRGIAAVRWRSGVRHSKPPGCCSIRPLWASPMWHQSLATPPPPSWSIKTINTDKMDGGCAERKRLRVALLCRLFSFFFFLLPFSPPSPASPSPGDKSGGSAGSQ